MPRRPGVYYVYIVANRYRTVYYVGITNDLERRIREHRAGAGSRFTSEYRITDLLYWEEHHEVKDAIAREKQVKAWSRAKKLEMIRAMNPELRDYSDQVLRIGA